MKLIIAHDIHSQQTATTVIIQNIFLLKVSNSSKRFRILFKLVSEAIELGSIPSWYQKARFLVGSQIGSQETPCNIMVREPQKRLPHQFW